MPRGSPSRRLFIHTILYDIAGTSTFHHSLLSFSLLLSYIFNPLPFEIISSTLLTSFHPLIFTNLLLVLSISRFFSFLFFPTTNPCGTSPAFDLSTFHFTEVPITSFHSLIPLSPFLILLISISFIHKSSAKTEFLSAQIQNLTSNHS